MAKRIRIIPWLDRDELDKQLNKIGKEKRKINIDVNGDGADDMVHKLHIMNSTGAKSTSIFGKMKNAISDTFSSGKLAMTGYLAVLRGIDTAADKAKDSIEELNKAETDLMIATDMSRESVRGLMKDYNSYAKELSSTTKDISDAANDYLRAGKTLEESQALIKDSIMLSKLGDIESATASEDLLATMNGYEMSIEEVDRALDAMVAIDMKAATSAGDLATGLKYSASSASAAELSYNKLIAILGTVQDKTQQSAETVGTFANAMLSRYRDVKIGNYLTEDGEDISDYESVLKSCGLELRDSQGEFRAFEDVLEDMAGAWDSLTSVQQNALIKVAAGTRNQNRFIALMEGYNKVLELTEVAATSAGTAVDKFNSSYMTSLEAKENTLQASFESMIYNSDLEELYGDILDATTALVNFINQTNALKGVMTGLAVTGLIKGFLTIKTGIHDAYINLNQFQNALNMVKQTNISSADFDRLLLLTNNLSESQMRLILSTDALSISQKEDLLVARGLSREEAKLKLQTYGVTQVQTGLTASTTSAKTAMQGFISVLKANPLFVIATAISAVSMAVSNYKNHLEEVRQATEQSATAYKESASSIDDYVSRYQDLQKALQDAKGNEEQTATVKQQLLDLQNELNDAYGTEYGKLNLVTDAYKDQTEAIRALNVEEANHYLNENRKGISTATQKMEKEQDYVLSAPTLSVDTPDGKALQEIVDSYTDEGMRLISDDATGAVQIVLKADAQTAYETLNNFETDLRNKAQELGNENLFDDILDFSTNALNNAKSTIDKYGEIYNQAQMANLVTDENASSVYEKALSAVEKYNDAVMKSEDPFNDENVAKAKANVESVMAEAEGLGKYGTIFADIFDQADRRLLDFNEKLKSDTSLQEWAKELEGLSQIELLSMADDDTEDVFDKLVASAEEYDISVEELIDALIRLGYVQGEVASQNIISGIDTISFDYEAFSDGISAISSAYDTLSAAVEEYNTNGAYSLDTVNKLMALQPEYLALLVNESGQLAINEQGLRNIVQAQLEKAQAEIYAVGISKLNALAQQDAGDAATTAGEDMANSVGNINSETEALSANAQAAIFDAKAKSLLNNTTDNITDEDVNAIIAETENQVKALQSAVQGLTFDVGGVTGGFKSMGSAAKGASKSTDALTESMKKQKEALESTKSELEKQKQYYEDVAEAIDWFYDKQIEKQEKAIDSLEKENELLEERIDYYDGALSAIDRYYEKQIEKLEEQKDALAGNNKEEEIALNLEKRKQELEEARNRKSILQYEYGKGFVYKQDEKTIKEAEDNLADAQRQKDEANIDAQIEKLKEYQALWAEIPSTKQKAEEDSRMIEMLGANWETILLEGRIQNITEFKDQYIAVQDQIDSNESLIASYEEKIAYYEALKTEWDNLLAKYTEDTYIQLLVGAFGNDYENELLNGRTLRWEQFAEDYYNIQVQLKEVTDQIETLAKRMEEYASRIESAANSAMDAVDNLANMKIPSVPTINNGRGASPFNGGGGNKYVASVKAKGGIITKKDAGDYDFVAKSLNEDHMVSLTEGEAVVPKETVEKNPEVINSLLSGQKLDLKSLVNRDIVLQRATPMDTYSMLEKYKDWVIPDSAIISRLNLPSQDFSKMGVINNNQKETVVQFNGDIHVHEVKDVHDFASKVIKQFPTIVTQQLGKL